MKYVVTAGTLGITEDNSIYKLEEGWFTGFYLCDDELVTDYQPDNLPIKDLFKLIKKYREIN